MMRCSKEAFAKCPTRHLCGSPNEATFTEGSDCDKFNRQVMDHPMTNADRIRAMSDEKLADKIYDLHVLLSAEGYYDLSTLFCDGKVGCITAEGEVHCCEERVKACIVRWLQLPAEEEST